ncbi:MAG: outer membrane protein assembly factor BamE [Desulfatiglans sp.]|jgi:hypothetical protein|nr:outer membrane protein assembly factor BamE [Desulfatiglans sp.]
MFKKIVGATILAAALFINPVTSEAKKDYILEGPVFMKVNIHYQNNGKDSKASYANYTNPGAGHRILAVNTPVQVKSWKRQGFIIVNTETNEEIFFEYQEARMQMTSEEYLNKITSPAKTDLSTLSEKDQKGIKEGIASNGMTKTGVMMALGYPATHRTPSIESNTWVYWSNRFKTIAVTFDDKGVVTAIQQ